MISRVLKGQVSVRKSGESCGVDKLQVGVIRDYSSFS
jgi:hypothetical protein